jgi:predicted metalloprotease with PDZ domain
VIGNTSQATIGRILVTNRKENVMRTILVALIAASASVAVAAPDTTKPSDPNIDDGVSVTVTAGRGRLGFAAIQISPELRSYLGAPSDRGVLVDSVRADSPAARAGLRVGDVVLAVDGTTAKSAMTILEALGDNKKGDRVTIEVMRGKSRYTLHATLVDDPGPDIRAFGRFEKGQMPDMEKMFPHMRGMLDDQDLKNTLEQMKKRLDEIEHRLDPKRT